MCAKSAGSLGMRRDDWLREGRLREPSQFVVLNCQGVPYSPNAPSVAFTRAGFLLSRS